MDSVDGQLRHKQPRQLCLCRHAAAGPRLSPASEPHVCLLGRRSDGFRRLAACCVPVALVGGRRGHAAALLVTRVGRAGVCCCYSLLATAHTVRVGTCGTLARPSGRRVHAFVCGCAHVNRPTPVCECIVRDLYAHVICVASVCRSGLWASDNTTLSSHWMGHCHAAKWLPSAIVHRTASSIVRRPRTQDRG